MVQLYLYSYRIEIEDADGRFSKILEWLQDDFKDFPQKTDKPKEIFKIRIGDFVQNQKLPWFYRPGVTVFGWGKEKNFKFKDSTKLTINFSKMRMAHIYGGIESVYEILYLLFLSTTGEWLEEDGWVRLHSLSFLNNEKACVLIAPQGFGKSYLANKMLINNQTNIQI